MQRLPSCFTLCPMWVLLAAATLDARAQTPERRSTLDEQQSVAITIYNDDFFDVTADKVQTDFKRRDSQGRWSFISESAYEVTLRNAKSEPVIVTVREPVPGDWTMLQESHKHEKMAAGAAQWRITVPAGGSSILKYRVSTRW
jgi:hypothetical protein